MRLLIVFFVLISKVGMGQSIPTFSKLLSDTFLITNGQNITSYDNSIYVSFISQNYQKFYQAISFANINNQGIEIKRKVLFNPKRIYTSNLGGNTKVTSKGDFICGCAEADTNRNYTSYLYKSRKMLDSIIKVKFDSIGFSINFLSVGELSDGNYILSGNIYSKTIVTLNNAFIIKVDTTGRILWQNSMHFDQSNVAYFTSPFAGGLYQHWVGFHNNTYNSGVVSGIFVDRYDNNGALQWRDTFGILGMENRSAAFSNSPDGGAVVVTNTIDTLNPFYGLDKNPYAIFKIDSLGKKVWTRYYSLYPNPNLKNGMVISKSGSIIICGKGGNQDSFTQRTGLIGGMIWKIDKNGNDIFKKLYQYDTLGGINELFDITETSDGGYAAVGNAFHRVGNQNVQAAWLLKVDSNGCLNGDCPTLYTAIEEPAPEQTFFVFPSPATVAFTVAISSAEDVYRYPHLHFALYDLMGRLVLDTPITQQTSTITREGIADGVYVYQLLDGDRYLMNGKMLLR